MKRGFTLVELSIVLVIIGLLIGGILVAQSMIGTSRIQSQIRQFQQFDIAATNFKSSYKQLPGDCNMCPRISASYAGNNNGRLEENNNTPAQGLWFEPYHYFIDLHQMGHLKDKYELLSSSYDIGVGKQFPKAAIGRGGIVANSSSTSQLYYLTIFRGSSTNESGYATLMAEGIFSPAEALAIDTKIDNGNPANGDTVSVSTTFTTGNYPLTISADNAANCISGGLYNVALPATNLCRLAVKANVH